MKQLNLFLNNPEETQEWMLSFSEKGLEKFVGPYYSKSSAKKFKEIDERLSGPYLIPENFDLENLIHPENYQQNI